MTFLRIRYSGETHTHLTFVSADTLDLSWEVGVTDLVELVSRANLGPYDALLPFDTFVQDIYAGTDSLIPQPEEGTGWNHQHIETPLLLVTPSVDVTPLNYDRVADLAKADSFAIKVYNNGIDIGGCWSNGVRFAGTPLMTLVVRLSGLYNKNTQCLFYGVFRQGRFIPTMTREGYKNYGWYGPTLTLGGRKYCHFSSWWRKSDISSPQQDYCVGYNTSGIVADGTVATNLYFKSLVGCYSSPVNAFDSVKLANDQIRRSILNADFITR